MMAGGDNLASELGEVLIVGGGKMGSGILAGLLSADAVSAADVVVANPGAGKRERLTAEYGVRCVADASEFPEPDTCILAIKPQIMKDVLKDLADSGFSPKRIVSVAAGIKTSTICGFFPDVPVIRTMPNMPLIYGHGVTGISPAEGTSDDEAQLVKRMFECMGVAEVVDESLQDAVVAVSGSGPAYFALMVEEIAEAGEELGLDRDIALELALHTMIGTGRFLEGSGKEPGQLVEDACTSGGTTTAAITAMRDGGIDQAIRDGVCAACERSKELS